MVFPKLSCSQKTDSLGKQKWRVIVDYQKLRQQTLPIYSTTWQVLIVLTLDFASRFHQIELDENDIPKTAFNTENGHYEYLCMLFGLKNAPATSKE